MARPKKELSPEELKTKQEQKEIEKKQKQEQREKEISQCILQEINGFSKTEINKFLDFCKTTNATQWDVVHLAINALLSGKIEYKVKTTTTLELK